MNRPWRRWPLVAVLSISGCGTVVDGTTQRMAVATSPPGAECGFYKRGVLIARVPATPGSANVDRDRQELLLLCVKPGSLPQTAFLRSEAKSEFLVNAGNFLLGAGPGWAIDSETNARLRYDQPGELTLMADQERRPETIRTLPVTLNDSGPPNPAEPVPLR